MLTSLGVPLLKWLHDKVCQFDGYLYSWLDTLDVFDDEAHV